MRPENITLGCSSTEIMRMAAEICLGPGKTLVTASPTFDFIAHAASLVGAEVGRHRSQAIMPMTSTQCRREPTLPPGSSTSVIPTTRLAR